MSVNAPKSDGDLLDLLRIRGPLGVSELADAMEVTKTRVRQRLTRLLATEMIRREAVRGNRGRPKQRYWLPERGRQFHSAAVRGGRQGKKGGENTWTRERLCCTTGALATPRVRADVEVPLTEREAQVLRHLAGGLTNKQIADALEISYETVKEHVQNVLRKIGVSDRTQAAMWAVRKGLA